MSVSKIGEGLGRVGMHFSEAISPHLSHRDAEFTIRRHGRDVEHLRIRFREEDFWTSEATWTLVSRVNCPDSLMSVGLKAGLCGMQFGRRDDHV